MLYPVIYFFSLSKLKSEIEQYLLENDFSLVDTDYSSDCLLVYTHNRLKTYNVEILTLPEIKHVVLDLEYIHGKDEFKITHIKDFHVTSLDALKLILTHSIGSPLFNEELLC